MPRWLPHNPARAPRRNDVRLWRTALIVFLPAALWLLFAGFALLRASLTPPDSPAALASPTDAGAMAGSGECRLCHPEQHESWFASYHRTMTQLPSPDSVSAPFAGEVVEYGGFRATMTRDSGAWWMHLESTRAPEQPVTPGPLGVQPVLGQRLSHRVVATVGSHRYQQYMTEADDAAGGWIRLPWAWHIATQRWIHMNAAFVEPEGRDGDWLDFQRHSTRWNDNCLFCHNTGASPGWQGQRFDSQVEEFGIACEACHGSGVHHVGQNVDPFRRMVAQGEGDPSIVSPHRLDPSRSSDVCGRCHGQRIGRDIERIMASGDGFMPGQPLQSVSRPIFKDSRVHGLPEKVFAERFWPDQTPRLSAYEYQGLLLSPCGPEVAGARAMGCGDCHTMHGDQPNGQLKPGMRGDRACTQCHGQATKAPLAKQSDRPEGHGGHALVAPEVGCMDCHMPYITYGLLEGMRSHRVTRPAPANWLGRDDQPDACTQCHVERTRLWAATAIAQMFPQIAPLAAPAAPDLESAPRVFVDLFMGDALQRNLAAHAVAQSHASGDRHERARWLAHALDDAYPSVRWFAWRGSLALARRMGDGPALELIQRFEHTGPLVDRVSIISALVEHLGPSRFEQTIEAMKSAREERPRQAIWIGE